MQLTNKKIPIADIYESYTNDIDLGVIAYNIQLNIRPPYQREFVYKIEQQRKVIESVTKNLPLNLIYFAKEKETALIKYELIDGQQRLMSICEYISNKFSVNNFYFKNLNQESKNIILKYQLDIYICEGTQQEKLDWFQTINISGEKLNRQELLNAIYNGKWITNMKKYFSKNNCHAYNIAKEYMLGTPIRQEYLAVVLKWLAHRDNCAIEDYIAKNQLKEDCTEEIDYFNNIILWTELSFNYRKILKGLNLGILYNIYNKNDKNKKQNEERIFKLIQDEEVTNKRGIYEYILSNDTKTLNLRTFSKQMKIEMFEKQIGICPVCETKCIITEMEADHIIPWSDGGKTNKENGAMICKRCNRRKSNK